MRNNSFPINIPIMEIVKLLFLFPVICSDYQEIELIKELTDYFNFDHHFFLLNSTADTNRYLNRKGHTPQSLFVFKSLDKVTVLEKIAEIRSKNTFLIVVTETFQLDQNSSLLRQIKEIHRLHINMKIGVFFSQQAPMEDLHKFFQWCKDNLIVDIFAVMYPCSSVVTQRSCPKCSINIFIFQSFGGFDVINMTGRETYDGFFPSQNSNFHRHQLRLGKQFDTLIDGKLWLTVFRLMNATFVVVKDNSPNVSEAFKRGIDLRPELIQQKPHVLGVYPVQMYSYGIFVPEALPYSEFSAYLRNAMSGEFGGYSCIAIVALVAVLSILRYVKQKKLVFFQSTADVFNLLMNDNGHIKYQRLSRPEPFVIVPLTFVGLIFTNGILSTFQSHLTQPLLQPQLKTLEDIYESGLSITVFHTGWKSQLIANLSNRTKVKDWSDKVHVESYNYHNYIETYNLTTVYFVNTNYAKVISRIQKRLKIKGYYDPDIRIGSYLFGYRLNDKFIYFNRLNEIQHRINSAGLYVVWQRQLDASKENEIINKNVERLIDRKENYVEKFEFPTFLTYGWLAGLIVFICEILWKHFNFSNIKKILCMVVRKLRN